MPEWLVLTLAMLATCGVVILIAVLHERRVSEDDDPSETPDVIEYMTMMVGVVYAIVLGLAIAGVWESRGAAQDNARLEAQALHEVSARAEVYAPPVRDRIRADVDAYVSHVVHTEWSVMIDKGELTDRGTELLAKLRKDVSTQVPSGELQGQNYQPMVDQVAAIDSARGAREQNAGPTMPGVVWFGLVLGAVLTVGMVFTLQIRRSWREMLLLAMFSALIVFLLFLVWDFDAPFGRKVSDSISPFTDLFPSEQGGA